MSEIISNTDPMPQCVQTDVIGWDIPVEVQNLINRGALFICNDSAGKDSQAMKILLKNIIPKGQLVIVHANLPEVEWEGNLDHIKKYSDNHPVVEVQANKTFFEMVENRFKNRPEVPSWPSAATRQCTSDLKRGPIQKFINNYSLKNGYKEVVNCIGLRAQESPGRAKKIPFQFKKINSCKHRQQYEWLPIHDWLIDRVWSTIENAGEKRHYAYDLGMSRLSCKYCIMSNDHDLKIAYQSDPELGNRYIAFEEFTGYTMSMSRISLKNTLAARSS